jgi:hypothetical protein
MKINKGFMVLFSHQFEMIHAVNGFSLTPANKPVKREIRHSMAITSL